MFFFSHGQINILMICHLIFFEARFSFFVKRSSPIEQLSWASSFKKWIKVSKKIVLEVKKYHLISAFLEWISLNMIFELEFKDFEIETV